MVQIQCESRLLRNETAQNSAGYIRNSRLLRKVCVAVGGHGTFVDAARTLGGTVLPIRSNEKGSTGFLLI
jgi:NAD kinase